MTDFDLLLTDVRIATMRPAADDFGIIDKAAIAFRDGAVAWLGPASGAPRAAATMVDSLDGRWLTPALIDCHTHLIFGGDRAAEFDRRQQGASYEEIAGEGGGILATVNATRSASDQELFESALRRVDQIVASGVATIEIKSGYGLDLANEIRMLEIARRIGEDSDVAVQTTLLAAHAVPPEFVDDPDAYIDLVCRELIPAVAGRKLADAVDAYCENLAFTPEQISKVFDCARSHGLRVKLHADQLSDNGGASLAAKFEALSADHLEYSTSDGVAALAKAGSVAVLLPGAYLTLGETRRPPVEEFRKHGVPMAIATDCNPGTSPLTSLRQAMAIGCRVFGLMPSECLAATTRNAARALALDDRGTLDVGRRADVAVWDVNHPRDLSYWMGADPLSDLFISGRSVSVRRS